MDHVEDLVPVSRDFNQVYEHLGGAHQGFFELNIPSVDLHDGNTLVLGLRERGISRDFRARGDPKGAFFVVSMSSHCCRLWDIKQGWKVSGGGLDGAEVLRSSFFPVQFHVVCKDFILCHFKAMRPRGFHGLKMGKDPA